MNLNIKKNKGFTLLEVLISLIIISIGLIGLAAMQMTALKNTNSSVQRLDAVNYAYDILDKMRSSRSLALSGSYNIALTAAAPTGKAAYETDLREWKESLKSMPSGKGSVTVTTGKAVIIITWEDSSNLLPTGTTSTVRVETEL